MMQLPELFLSETRRLLGAERFARFLAAMDEDAPVSLRLNPRKAVGLDVPPSAGGRVPWCDEGRYLAGRPAFTFDPLLHAGAYYVQEASSMFIAHILRQYVKEPVAMLDMCAAPGGKSTAARTALPQGSLLVSNEPLRQRAQVLLENLLKWGWDDTLATCNYPQDYSKSGACFDVVLCDVPCSGEGMFRKDPQAVAEWSPQNVERCSQLQREIVAHAWKCLAPGGLLVYSTCTFNTKENEENVKWMADELGARVLPVATEAEWGICGSLLAGFDEPVYRFVPGLTRGEGLFMCALRKPGDAPSAESRQRARRSLPALVAKKLNVLQLPAKEKAGLPSHAEALTTTGEAAQYARAELDYATAMAYLRSEAVVLPPTVPRGPVVVTFRGLPLGFVKNIGSRANNLYPKEWRIKSTHIPQDYEAILRPA